MNFKEYTIAPKGRNKYGVYASTGNISRRIVQTKNGGNASTGGGNGTDTGSTEPKVSWSMTLSQTSCAFEGDKLALAAQSASTQLFGFKDTDRAQTFIGDISLTADTANYSITGITSGISVSVANNGTSATTLTITAASGMSATKGNLIIPCNVYIGRGIITEESHNVSWNNEIEKVQKMNLEYSWNVTNPNAATSNYLLDLSNQNASVNCDSAGTIYTASTAQLECKATLYLGQQEYTGATYIIDNRGVSAIQINTNTGQLTFGSNMQFTDSPLIIFVSAKVGDITVGTKTMTIVKSYPGSDGSPAVSKWIKTSASSIKYNPNELTVTPSTLTATAMKQVGGDAPEVATGETIYYGYNTSTPSSTATGTITLDAIDVTKDYINFALKNGSTYYEMETIPILRDGANATGQSVYRLDLSNQNASINADYNGVILPAAARPECTATLYYGQNAATGVTYSIATATTAYTGVSINSTTGVITVGANFNFSGTGIQFSIQAKQGQILRGTAIFNISKNISGQPGSSGKGVSAVTNYYCATTGTTAPAKSSYVTTIPTDYGENKPYLWGYERVTYTDGTGYDTTASIIGKYGKDGQPGKGISAITEYYQITSSSTQYTSNWSTTVPTMTDEKPYLWNYEHFTYSDSTTGATTPKIIGIKGSDGANATSYWIKLTANAVKVTTGGTATPSTISAQAWQQVGENDPEQISASYIKYGYNTDSPTTTYSSTITVDKTKNYLVFNLIIDNVVRDVETVPIVKDGDKGDPGAQGRTGAAIRGPYLWGSNTDYRRFSNGEGPLEADTKYIDIIYRQNNGTWTYYKCNTSYYGDLSDEWGSVASAWTATQEQYDFIAANLLLANNAKINFMTGNEIYLMNASGTTVTAGAAGGEGISFWAGAAEPSNAPFQVNYDGTLTAKAGTFAGAVQLPYTFVAELRSNGVFSASTTGTFDTYDKVFKGNLSTAPANPQNDWWYYNTSNNNYYLYRNGWVLIHYLYVNGYIADGRTNLICDGKAGVYGMGDGADLILPTPSSAYNGYTYHIIMEPNIATKVIGQNGSCTIRARDNSYLKLYIHGYVINYSSAIQALMIKGGYMSVTCAPMNIARTQFQWIVTECTGDGTAYSISNNSYSWLWSFGNVYSYANQGSSDYCINRIVADRASYSETNSDTMYITRT